jgi:GGDEF domain-containing protein
MSLQGPLILVADGPAPALVDALTAAGAFPVVESKWTDAPAAFASVKPTAVVIAEPGVPAYEAAGRKLGKQIATASGPLVPVVARVDGDADAALPIALPIDAGQPTERLIARLQSAMRVRALHATVLRRVETFAGPAAHLPALPLGDALDDAAVLIAGRGPLYPKLSVVMGEQVKVLGALSVEGAARQLHTHDVDGIVVGDGFSPRRVQAFLTVLTQDARFRDVPLALVGEPTPELIAALPTVDHIHRDPARLVARTLPLVRMHAFEARLTRMLKSLDANGMFDPHTGLHSRDAFYRELAKCTAEAAERGTPLSLARLSFDAPRDARIGKDAARLLTRHIRAIDFACRDEDGALLIAFTQTDLRSAHVVARRIAGQIKNALSASQLGRDAIAASLTLATLKADDTLDSLLARVAGGRMVAAE